MNTLEHVKKLAVILLGNFLYALAVAFLLFRVTELIRQIAPEAGLIIEQVKEVRGRGLTARKKYGADGENGWNSCVSSGDLL